MLHSSLCVHLCSGIFWEDACILLSLPSYVTRVRRLWLLTLYCISPCSHIFIISAYYIWTCFHLCGCFFFHGLCLPNHPPSYCLLSWGLQCLLQVLLDLTHSSSVDTLFASFHFHKNFSVQSFQFNQWSYAHNYQKASILMWLMPLVTSWDGMISTFLCQTLYFWKIHHIIIHFSSVINHSVLFHVISLLHMGIHDRTTFTSRSVICVNFKSIPDVPESSLVQLEFMNGGMLMLSFFFCYAWCCCRCQSPSCPVPLQTFPMGVGNEALFMMHTASLAVPIRLTVWWRWSTCSGKGTLLVLSQVCHTRIASCFSIVSLILLFPSYFPSIFCGFFCF